MNYCIQTDSLIIIIKKQMSLNKMEQEVINSCELSVKWNNLHIITEKYFEQKNYCCSSRSTAD